MTKSARSSSSRSAGAKKRKQPLDVEPRSPSLAGHTAIVTGSSKGLGKAMAIALGEAGAKVVVNYYNGKEQRRSLEDTLTYSPASLGTCATRRLCRTLFPPRHASHAVHSL